MFAVVTVATLYVMHGVFTLDLETEASPLEKVSLIGEESLVEDWVLEGDEGGNKVPRCENDQRAV